MTEVKELQKQLAKLSEDMARLAGAQENVTFADQALKHLGLKLANPTLRSATKRSFENQVTRHLVPSFGELPINKIGNPDWLKWVTETRERGEVTKFFNARKALIEIMTQAREEGHLERVPKFDSPDEYEPVGRVLEQKEILGIIWKTQRPFRVIFHAFWRMGCRPREILQWEWSMFEWSRPGRQFSYVTVPGRITKTGRTRTIPLDPSVVRILKARYRRGNGSKYVFPKRLGPDVPQWSYQSAWVTACRKARVKDAQVYDCRRTLVTKWAAAGKSENFIALQLDTSPAMIRRFYLKRDEDAMEGLFL